MVYNRRQQYRRRGNLRRLPTQLAARSMLLHGPASGLTTHSTVWADGSVLSRVLFKEDDSSSCDSVRQPLLLCRTLQGQDENQTADLSQPKGESCIWATRPVCVPSDNHADIAYHTGTHWSPCSWPNNDDHPCGQPLAINHRLCRSPRPTEPQV
jgi:hypothetical protein